MQISLLVLDKLFHIKYYQDFQKAICDKTTSVGYLLSNDHLEQPGLSDSTFTITLA